MDNPISKACTKCREVKPLEEFTPGQGRYGRRARCRLCVRKPRKTTVLHKTDTHKECRKCGRILPHRFFGSSGKSLKGHCRDCHGRMTSEWYSRNSEKVRANARGWRRKNPEIVRYHRAKRRAFKASVLHIDFTADQLAQRAVMFDDACWMCGESWTDWDHVKPLSKGGAHCLANLRPACGSCNSRKHARWLGAKWASELRIRKAPKKLLASC